MNYTRARLIIWNPAAYDAATVRKAAVFILGMLRPATEDIYQASSLL